VLLCGGKAIVSLNLEYFCPRQSIGCDVFATDLNKDQIAVKL
jgi:hypothetical protein